MGCKVVVRHVGCLPGHVGDVDLLAHTSAGVVEKLLEVGVTVDHKFFTTLVAGKEEGRTGGPTERKMSAEF